MARLFGRRAALAAVLTLLAFGGVPAQGNAESAKGSILGLRLEADRAGEVPVVPEGTVPAPRARVVVRWADVERQAGVYDWSIVGPDVATLADAGYLVTVCLDGPNRLYAGGDASEPSPLEPGVLEAWAGFARSAVRSLEGSIEVLEVLDRPDALDPTSYAFLLKTTALAVRAEADSNGASVRIAQGPIGIGSMAWQRSLWLADSAPYIDVLPVVVGPDDEVESSLSHVRVEAAGFPPAPEFRVYASNLAQAVRAVAAGADAGLTALSPGEAGRAEADLTVGLQVAIGSGFAPAPVGATRVLDADGGPLADGAILGRFLHGEDFSTRIVYLAPPGSSGDEQGWIEVEGTDVRNARTIDPVGGRELRTAAVPAPDGSAARRFRVPLGALPRVLAFDKAVQLPGLDLPPEELEIAERRGLTAEEIIARHQQAQEIQDDRLMRWTARGRIDFHFKIAQGGSTIDVGIESNYFWERGGQVEWEQTDYFINGNKVTWKKIPELPLIQPEKVVTLPLDLTLDKTYSYRLRGEDEVGGRPAWVLEFEPAVSDTDRSLYRGRVWIDRETFVRLKSQSVQTNLEPPVLSNEEIDLFAPIQGPDGHTYWLLSRIDGQQLWSVGGRNFVVNREIAFSSYEVNPARPAFETARAEAYARTNQMIRDTDEGYRYLERNDDGTRSVKTEVETHKWFAAAGGFRDASTSAPLAGVNFLDYDLFGRNIQFNALLAGVVNFVNVADPEAFGKRMDLAVDVVGVAIKGEDRVYLADDEIREERIEDRNQFLGVRLGIPIGSFFKLTIAGNAAYRQYFDNDDARAARGATFGFVLPRDHTEIGGTIQAEFNRLGWNLTASGTVSRRSAWEPWGLTDASTGAFVDPEFDPSHEKFTTWRVIAFKEWYLPRFQKLRTEIDYLDGSDLDRFSKYQFSLFGDDRLNGFAGTGVRFDRGAIARAGWSFNLFEAIRLDLAVDSARVTEKLPGADWRSFTGAGLSTNFVGPWQTVVSFSYGRSIDSDIPDLKGEQEFLLLVLKLF